MVKKIFLLLLFIGVQLLFALDIQDDHGYMRHYDLDELTSLSFQEQDGTIINLLDILPIYRDIIQLDIISSSGLLNLKNTDDIAQAKLFIQNGQIELRTPLYSFQAPNSIRIHSSSSGLSNLTVWVDSTWQDLVKDLEIFGEFHNIEMNILLTEDLANQFAESVIYQDNLPDFIFYSHKDYSYVQPYIMELTPGNSSIALLQRIEQAQDSLDMDILELMYLRNNYSSLSMEERLTYYHDNSVEIPEDLYEIDKLYLSSPRGLDSPPPVSYLLSFYAGEREKQGLLSVHEDLFDISAVEDNWIFWEYNWYNISLLDKWQSFIPLLNQGILSAEQCAMELKEQGYE
ncbi:MAG: hypothetical protein PF447_04080 [Spirochaetaceae bacterium]|jgi:hypothetical protein|nr:hypothetical protein [Spirochaetaceae bacterium]